MENNEKLAQLIADINDEADEVEKYNTDNTDCSAADYAKSFGYGETDTDDMIKVIDKEFNEEGDYDHIIDRLKKDNSLFDTLSPHTELIPGGMHVTHGEIFSMRVGEVEHQLDETILNQLSALTSEELAHVSKNIDCYLSGECIYVDCSYDRWILTLDFDSLVESIEKYPALKLV
jgi:hypothetical protein